MLSKYEKSVITKRKNEGITFENSLAAVENLAKLRDTVSSMISVGNMDKMESFLTIYSNMAPSERTFIRDTVSAIRGRRRN
jgi:hypothetical protein